MPPAPAVRDAEKLVSVPVAPVRPNTESALPVPVMARSAAVPVLRLMTPLTLTEEAVWPVATATVAAPLAIVAVRTPVAISIAFSVSVIVADCRKTVELPLPSVTMLPLTPEPDATLAASGVGALRKVMVLPLTFSVEPSAIRLPAVAALVVRVAPTVVMPEPSAVVRPKALRKSALPLTLEIATGRSLQADRAGSDRGDGLAGVGRRGRDAGSNVEDRTPLARSIARSTSPTVAVEVVELAPI